MSTGQSKSGSTHRGEQVWPRGCINRLTTDGDGSDHSGNPRPNEESFTKKFHFHAEPVQVPPTSRSPPQRRAEGERARPQTTTERPSDRARAQWTTRWTTSTTPRRHRAQRPPSGSRAPPQFLRRSKSCAKVARARPATGSPRRTPHRGSTLICATFHERARDLARDASLSPPRLRAATEDR